jgi:hypothetical protein
MSRASLIAIIAFLLGLPAPAALAEPEDAQAAAKDTDSTDEDERDSRPALPENAEAALVRASAAYEYGDMYQVVEAARPVTEGLVPASESQQAKAFRLFGIGLYLTNRQAGAETAFKELLRLEPSARLNPTTTRPEVVAFFESLRREQNPDTRRVIWNFIPPVGQFQNGDNIKGWVVLGVGVASFGVALASRLLPLRWKGEGYTYGGHEDTVETLETVNWISTGVLAATYLYGVFDGIIGYSRPLDDDKHQLGLRMFSDGTGIGFAF